MYVLRARAHEHVRDEGADEGDVGTGGTCAHAQSPRSRRERLSDPTVTSLRPTDILVISGLPGDATEDTLSEAIRRIPHVPERLRLLRDDNGNSLRVALLEFKHVNSAVDFMNFSHRTVMLDDRPFDVHFSRRGQTASSGSYYRDRGRHYGGRDRRVATPPPPVQLSVNQGDQDVTPTPSTVVLVQGLDALTSEESLFDQLLAVAPILQVRLVRDMFSHVSCGFAFVDVADTMPAQTLVDKGRAGALVVDGRTVKTNFANPVTAGPYLPRYWDPQMYWKQFWRADPSQAPAAPAAPAPASVAAPTAPPAAAAAVPAVDEDDALASFYELLAPALEPEAEPAVAKATAAASGPSIVDVLLATSRERSQGSSLANVPVRYDPSRDAAGPVPAPASPPAADRVAFSLAGDGSEPEAARGPVVIDEESLIDRDKMHCLLCQRAFKSVAVLEKHVVQSDLHKENLEKKRRTLMKQVKTSLPLDADEQAERIERELKYRNRAAERRQMHGNAAPRGKRSNDADAPIEPEQPTKNGIGEDNIGSRLMQQMGWQRGTGLGRNQSGMVNPIQVEMYARGAGLGSAGASGGPVDPNATYTDAVRRAARSRFDGT